MTIVTLDPTCAPAPDQDGGPGPLAPRPASLHGKKVGFLMNRLADCELMFDALYDELGKLDDVAGIVKVEKDSQSVPATPEQWAELTTRADVVVTGFGGCGSCSTRSMRDALDLELAGIPAVCVVHRALVPAVRVIAELAERPDYHMVVVDYPHSPIAKWDEQEAAEIAREVAAQVRSCLVS